METSTWPPRIMPKDSEESKVEAPGTKVTVCLPALTRSLLLKVSLLGILQTHSKEKSKTYASTSSSVGCGPMPKRPFSLCSHTVLSFGTKHAAMVGMPTPRLT